MKIVVCIKQVPDTKGGVKFNPDGTLGKKLEQASSAASGKFTYDPDTKALTFNTGEIADGGEILVHYNRHINAAVLDNLSDTYSGKCKLIFFSS